MLVYSIIILFQALILHLNLMKYNITKIFNFVGQSFSYNSINIFYIASLHKHLLIIIIIIFQIRYFIK